MNLNVLGCPTNSTNNEDIAKGDDKNEQKKFAVGKDGEKQSKKHASLVKRRISSKRSSQAYRDRLKFIKQLESKNALLKAGVHERENQMMEMNNTLVRLNNISSFRIASIERFSELLVGGVAMHDPSRLCIQVESLKSTMARDMVIAGKNQRGPLAVAEMFLTMQDKVQNARFSVNSFQVIGPNNEIVHVDLVLSGYVTRKLVSLFPHMLNDEEFVQRVIGKKIHIPLTRRMYYEKEEKLASYFQPGIDWVAAWRPLLNDLGEIFRVVQTNELDQAGVLVHLQKNLEIASRFQEPKKRPFPATDLVHPSSSCTLRTCSVPPRRRFDESEHVSKAYHTYRCQLPSYNMANCNSTYTGHGNMQHVASLSL